MGWQLLLARRARRPEEIRGEGAESDKNQQKPLCIALPLSQMFSSTTAIVFCASDLVKASRNSWNQVKIAQQLLPPVTEGVGLIESDNKYIIT